MAIRVGLHDGYQAEQLVLVGWITHHLLLSAAAESEIKTPGAAHPICWNGAKRLQPGMVLMPPKDQQDRSCFGHFPCHGDHIQQQ